MLMLQRFQVFLQHTHTLPGQLRRPQGAGHPRPGQGGLLLLPGNPLQLLRCQDLHILRGQKPVQRVPHLIELIVPHLVQLLRLCLPLLLRECGVLELLFQLARLIPGADQAVNDLPYQIPAEKSLLVRLVVEGIREQRLPLIAVVHPAPELLGQLAQGRAGR